MCTYFFFVLIEIRGLWVSRMIHGLDNRLSVAHRYIEIVIYLLIFIKVKLVLVIVSFSLLSFLYGLDPPQLLVNDGFNPVILTLHDLALHVFLVDRILHFFYLHD